MSYTNDSFSQNYDDEGYINIKKFINSDDIDEMNRKIDEIMCSTAISDEIFDESGTGKIKQIQYLHKKDKIFEELVKKLIPLAEKLTKTENLSLDNVLNVQLFEKHPEISKPTRSHQDNAYFKVTPADAITFWLALDDIDEENGAIYYAPKTHLTPTRRHQRYHTQTTFRTRSGVPGLSLCLKEHPEETDIRMDVGAGDLLAHHCNLVHRAGKNNSENRRRRAIGVVFIPGKCKTDERLKGYHLSQLKEDIELQRVKDPLLYKKLREQYAHLY